MPQRHMLILAGELDYLIRFRSRLIKEICKRGLRVTVCSPDDDSRHREFFDSNGIEYVRIKMSRAGINPIADLESARGLSVILRRLRPSDVFAYGAKPILIGLSASLVCRIPRTYAMLAGLGYAFTDAPSRSAKRFIARFVQSVSFRILLRRSRSVIFHNSDDRDLLVGKGVLRQDRTVVVPGSGVNLNDFKPSPVPLEPVRFVFVGRLLKSKGVTELLLAAETLRVEVPNAEIHLIGALDVNPDSIEEDLITAARQIGNVTFHGQLADVRPVLERASAFVLPSYREGLPRSALEALAMGRTAIVTDVPGCREVVNPGVYGALVPPRNPVRLARTLVEYARDPERLQAEGAAARRAAESRFSDVEVNRQMMQALEVD